MRNKILLSAYSCEPNRGSESEVGWGWALNLSKKGHDVYIVTRANQKSNIDIFIKKERIINLNFIFFDYPSWFIKIFKNKKSPTSYFYILFWQIGIFFKVYPFIKKIKFDFIHHVTFVSHRIPSFLSLYNIPFIFGPISGGDKIPVNLRNNFSFLERLLENIRDLSNSYIKISPLMNLVFFRSKKIYVNSLKKKKNIPSYLHKKTEIMLGIGINDLNEPIERKKIDNGVFKICFGGNLINIKGIHILMKTFLNLSTRMKCELNIFGNGNKKQYVLDFIKKNKLEKKVNLYNQLPRNEYLRLLDQNHLLFIPTLRDSGSFVVLEAMTKGIPCAVLDLGGPNILVNQDCGIKIENYNKKENQIVNDFTLAIQQLSSDPTQYQNKSNLSIEQAKKFTWRKKIEYIY